jgi:hypothetical protein
LSQRLAPDVIHGVVDKGAGFTHGVDRHDVVVLEAGRDARGAQPS